MFNTTILDVAIGMIFIYLLLSLMCTAANEIIELMLKKRAIDLERGIRELLAPGSKSGTDDVVSKLYNHPLVNSLFGGRYEESRIESTIKRKILRTALPSYIPTRTFALALMDLVLPGISAPPAGAGAAGAAAPAATLSGAAGATPPPSNFEVKLAAPLPPPPPVTDPSNPLARLRNAVGANSLLTEHAKNALTALIDAAGSDVAKARENIEGWYDTSMDRVSSWYKRRTQVVLMILGLFVAVTVNADSITIAKRLSTDRSLRESLVAAAQDYAKVNATETAKPTATPSTQPTKPKETSESTENSKTKAKTESTGTPSTTATAKTAKTAESKENSSSTPTPASDSTGSAKTTATTTPPPACVKDKDSKECKQEENLLKIPACAKDRDSQECKRLLKVVACAEDGDSAECKFEQDCVTSDGLKNTSECKYRESLMKVQGLGLPIGWDDKSDPQRYWTKASWSWKGDNGGWSDQLYWHWLGWLLTALPISLGAPFWFDLLNKFIVIRSAVKPHEKSPEEGSKD